MLNTSAPAVQHRAKLLNFYLHPINAVFGEPVAAALAVIFEAAYRPPSSSERKTRAAVIRMPQITPGRTGCPESRGSETRASRVSTPGQTCRIQAR